MTQHSQKARQVEFENDSLEVTTLDRFAMNICQLLYWDLENAFAQKICQERILVEATGLVGRRVDEYENLKNSRFVTFELLYGESGHAWS